MSLDEAHEIARALALMDGYCEEELRLLLAARGTTEDVIELACQTFRYRREGIPI